MSWYHPKNLLDDVFEGGIILKGIGGALEFIGGLLLIFIKPEQIHHFVFFITKGGILMDENHRIMNHLFTGMLHISAGDEKFAIAYLWIHAAIKLIAAIGILKNKLWAYPFSLITLGIFALYQIYSMIFIKFSIVMLLLTIFDLFVLWMIFYEYGKNKKNMLQSSKEYNDN